MLFSEFEKRIVKVTKLELPGEDAHEKMAPIERLTEIKQQARSNRSARTAAVLSLFYPSRNGQTNLALILRKSYVGVHSAQISFPGGKREIEDESLLYTALRETEEEVGVQIDSVNILKELTQVYIPPSNFFVQPYMGISITTPSFKIQETEVEKLIEVPLSHFMDEEVQINTRLSTSYGINIEVPAFLLNDYVVWGATAMMLSEILELLKKAL
jgi:8-oxo-dGTP pyrophosphatase MutT (NUDIX family)